MAVGFVRTRIIAMDVVDKCIHAAVMEVASGTSRHAVEPPLIVFKQLNHPLAIHRERHF